MSTWKTKGEALAQEPKWLPRETTVTVVIQDAFEEREMDGNWGKRTVYIITTEEYGKVFVSQTTFAKIAKSISELPENATSLRTTV